MAPGTLPVTHAIPLHRTPFEDADSDLVGKALKSGLLVGDGAASHVLAAAARRTLGCSHAFTTPSCTHALELMMRALPLEPGDEVICPSFTFVSAANAVMLAGGRVVFAEVEPDTLNLDPTDAASRNWSGSPRRTAVHFSRTPRTRSAAGSTTSRSERWAPPARSPSTARRT